MILEWFKFKIDLASLNDFLKQNIPNADGIVASPKCFEIMEKSPLTSDEQELINNYLNSLTAEGEQEKLNGTST